MYVLFGHLILCICKPIFKMLRQNHIFERPAIAIVMLTRTICTKKTMSSLNLPFQASNDCFLNALM